MLTSKVLPGSKNETGMAFLLSIVISFILTAFLLHTLTLYESEKQFLYLEKEWNSLDNLIVTGLIEVLYLKKQSEEVNLVAGKILLENGTINYEIVNNGSSETIFLEVWSVSGKVRRARFEYDDITGELTKWIEGVRKN